MRLSLGRSCAETRRHGGYWTAGAVPESVVSRPPCAHWSVPADKNSAVDINSSITASETKARSPRETTDINRSSSVESVTMSELGHGRPCRARRCCGGFTPVSVRVARMHGAQCCDDQPPNLDDSRGHFSNHSAPGSE
jgi:hypothetical protein